MYGEVGGADRNQCGYREYPDYEHLRTSYHQYDGSYYLFVSNAFDANITVSIVLRTYTSSAPPTGSFLRFQLDQSEAVWESGAIDIRGGRASG